MRPSLPYCTSSPESPAATPMTSEAAASCAHAGIVDIQPQRLFAGAGSRTMRKSSTVSGGAHAAMSTRTARSEAASAAQRSHWRRCASKASRSAAVPSS